MAFLLKGCLARRKFFYRDKTGSAGLREWMMTSVLNDTGEGMSLNVSLLRGHESVQQWNATGTDYPRDKTVAQLFEETAASFAHSTAVVFEDQQVTYRELNARADYLANRLRRMEVGRETMVGCCIDRSVELIVAIIAILKAGGAYVPLDPTYPKERFDFLLADTRPPLILDSEDTRLNRARGLRLSHFVGRRGRVRRG